MTTSKTLFIGGGNMARAIVGGLVKHGYDPKNIYVVDPNMGKREALVRDYQVHVSENLRDFMPLVDTMVLAIKPQGAQELCASLRDALAQRSPLVISIMAGVNLASLQQGLGEHLPIIRAMPNTPALVGAGATAFTGNAIVSAAQYTEVEQIFQAIGIVARLDDESQINVITALSGSGPAYYFYFMDAMQNAAIGLGLDPDIAKQFAIQTAYGAAKLARSKDTPLVTLREEVTSKKGTTAAALEVMQTQGLERIIAAAIQAATARAIGLSQNP